MRSFGATIVVVVIALFALLMSVFVVDQRQQVVVQRAGAIQRTIDEPGLYFKIPILDEIYRYEDRLLPLDSEAWSVLFKDNRRLEVDAFSRWRIDDPEAYHVAVRQNGAAGAQDNLAGILEEKVRDVLGDVDADAVLSVDRTRLMNSILDAARTDAAQMGVRIVDVRIVRADLPDANMQATFERMSAERQQEAADERARGDEEARVITANAERTAATTVAEAKRDAEIIKGEADAERNAIYAGAYTQDQEFFDFYRSLQAYEEAMRANNTTVVIDPDDDFFRFMKSESGAQ